MPAGFAISTGGAVALVAATAKSVLSAIPAASKGFQLVEFEVAFDGISATAVPVLVELCASSGAGAGTSTSVTPNIVRGWDGGISVDGTAAKNYSAEPTTLTVLREFLVPPTSGIVLQYPLGREPVAANLTSHPAKGGLILRCTAPAAVNVRATMEIEQ